MTFSFTVVRLICLSSAIAIRVAINKFLILLCKFQYSPAIILYIKIIVNFRVVKDKTYTRYCARNIFLIIFLMLYSSSYSQQAKPITEYTIENVLSINSV